MRFLYAAYAATGVIHLAYLVILWRGFRRLRREEQEFGRDGM